MRSILRISLAVWSLGLFGCAGGQIDDRPAEGAEAGLGLKRSPAQNGLTYYYVTKAPADAQGGPLALRRANPAKQPLNDAYGWPFLPPVRRAAQASVSQAEFDALVNMSYQGEVVVALIGSKDNSGVQEIYEIYYASEQVPTRSVEKVPEILYRVVDGAVVLVNENAYDAGPLAISGPASADAIRAGAFFLGSITVSCPWFKVYCDAPTAAKANTLFSR
jgi:hypothetical protein